VDNSCPLLADAQRRCEAKVINFGIIYGMRVPLKVDVGWGEPWHDAH
jgi:DNA polymerase I-like protein with 3'-5' exonuclease and polymerase domains